MTSIQEEGEKDAKKHEVYARMERDLNLVFCSGVEDKLQDDVPETIAALKNAGIKVWVLTGDKVETAVQIGQSCNLLNDRTFNTKLESGDASVIEEQLEELETFMDAAQLLSDCIGKGLTFDDKDEGGDGAGNIGRCIKFCFWWSGRLDLGVSDRVILHVKMNCVC